MQTQPHPPPSPGKGKELIPPLLPGEGRVRLYYFTKYRLQRFSPVLLRTPSLTIETNSLCNVFSLQDTRKLACSGEFCTLSFMSFMVAPPSIVLIIFKISSRLCFFNTSKTSACL